MTTTNKKSNTVVFNNILEMVGFLKTNGTNCCFVSLLSDTEPKLKKDCPHKNVRKIARRWGWLNINYNTAVRRRIAAKLGVKLAEAEYENGEVWYRHELTAEGKSLPLLVNKKVPMGEVPPENKYYVQYFPHRSKTKYIAENGDEIPEADLEPYFYAKGKREEFKPLVCCFGLENVAEMKVSGIVIRTPETKAVEEILG